MKSFFFFVYLILLSFGAKADPSECQKSLNDIRLEMKVISSNIANFNTTRTPEGGPYEKREVICFNNVCEIIRNRNFVSKFEPTHPDANDNGYVKYPQIELMVEISNMINAARDYEEIVASCN